VPLSKSIKDLVRGKSTLQNEILGDLQMEFTSAPEKGEYHQSIYQTVGSCGSALTVVPFNQGSKQDVKALVDYIYPTLGMDLEYYPSLPFPRMVVKLIASMINRNLRAGWVNLLLLSSSGPVKIPVGVW
jgi:Fatty acid synthase subunit alpha Acyl carrier domain